MQDLLVKLGIHWSQLLAQIVNFAIVTGVLQYFLYKPLLKIIDERRETVRKSMEDAKRIQTQKEELDVIRKQALAALDKETGALLEKAKKEAETLRQDILASARHEADAILVKAGKQMEEERRSLFEEAQKRLTSVIIGLTEKLIQREFSPADQKRLVETLEKDLPTLVR